MARGPRPKAPQVPEVEPEGLSPQQREIWRLARAGCTVDAIAENLGTSPDTVYKQLKRIRIIGTTDLNRKARPVSHALDPPEDALQELLPDATIQEKVELLSRTGHYSARAIAEHIGTTENTVWVMRSRMKKRASAHGRVLRRRATPEELSAISARSAADPDIISSMTYEVYMQDDPFAPEAVQARRLLAALGGGGPDVKRLAFSDRAKKLKKLLAEKRGLLKTLGRATAALVRDVIEPEFTWLDDVTFKPRRRSSWETLRAAVRDRFLAAAGGLVGTEPAGVEEEGLPVWRVWMAGEVAAAVRSTPQGLKVARALRSVRGGRVEVRGTVLQAGGGLVKIATPEETVEEVPATGLVVKRRGALWETADAGLVGPGDEVAVLEDGRLKVDAKDLEIVVLSDNDVAFLAAWCMIGEPCWVEMAGPDGLRRWRCELPASRTVAVVDVASLELGPDAADDGAEAVKVRLRGDKYLVVAGRRKAAEAAAAGAEEIPVIIEQPIANLN